MNKTTTPSARPLVFDYGSSHLFLKDLLNHYKITSRFSIRQQVKKVSGCSPALITQVLSGKRRLTRDQLPRFAKIFKLSAFELDFIDKALKSGIGEEHTESLPVPAKIRVTKNHILSKWFYLYVKDLASLKGFAPDPRILFKMFYGHLNQKQIQKAIAFLIEEGFWRRTSNGKIVLEEPALVSSNEIPNENIKKLHRQAIKLALKGLDVFSVDRRKASTVLLAVDKSRISEIRDMMDDFQNRLLKFIEDNSDGCDELVQFTMHLTPVGGTIENK